MPLLLLPNLALCFGCALALACPPPRSGFARAQARGVVLAFSGLALFPGALFPALAAPAWSLGGLLEVGGASLPLLVVAAALGAASCVAGFELAHHWQRRRTPELGSGAPLAVSSVFALVVLIASADRLAQVPVPVAPGIGPKLVSLAEGGWVPLLTVLAALELLAFGLCFQALRRVARPELHARASLPPAR